MFDRDALLKERLDRYRQLIYEDPGGLWYGDETRESREKRDTSGITTQRERKKGGGGEKENAQVDGYLISYYISSKDLCLI